MVRTLVDPADPGSFTAVAHALRQGAVAVIPTDTVYGFSARIDRPKALARIAEAKRRQARSPFLVLIDAVASVTSLSPAVPHPERVASFWPGPTTVLLPARKGLPGWLVGDGGTVALRCPQPSWLRALVRDAGAPLASTSVNVSGEPSLHSPAGIAAAFGRAIDVLADMGPQTGSPSTIVDLSTPTPRIVRGGASPPLIASFDQAFDLPGPAA